MARRRLAVPAPPPLPTVGPRCQAMKCTCDGLVPGPVIGGWPSCGWCTHTVNIHRERTAA